LIGLRLSALLVKDRPRRVGWSSLDLASPISDVRCRRRGYCPLHPGAFRRILSVPTKTTRMHGRFQGRPEASTRPRHPPSRSCEATSTVSERLPSCHERPVFRASNCAVRSMRSTRLDSAPFSPQIPLRRASARPEERSSGSLAVTIGLAALRPRDTAMRRTDFCQLTRMLRAPAPRWFPMRSPAFAAAASRRSSASRSERFASAGRAFATEPLVSLSLPLLRRGVRTQSPSRRAAEHRLRCVRVNVAHRMDERRYLPSTRSVCPATPSRASGSRLLRPRSLAAAPRSPAPFHFAERHSALLEVRSPYTRPVAGGMRFSRPRLGLSTSATLDDTRAHPTSFRPSRASGTFVPLLAGMCRLRWPSDASPHRWPASHGSFAWWF